MGRGVSVPGYAEAVVYYDVSDLEDSGDWRLFVYDVTHQLKKSFPSLRDCDKWLDREDKAILCNDFAFFGLSEYGGCASLWIVPMESDKPGLEAYWIGQAGDVLGREYGNLQRLGGMSNGESVYRRKG